MFPRDSISVSVRLFLKFDEFFFVFGTLLFEDRNTDFTRLEKQPSCSRRIVILCGQIALPCVVPFKYPTWQGGYFTKAVDRAPTVRPLAEKVFSLEL